MKKSILSWLFADKKSGCCSTSKGTSIHAANAQEPLQTEKGEAKGSSCACCCSGTRGSGIRSIKVLGVGCKSCNILMENTQAAACAIGLETEVQYITDLAQISTYGVMSMPALVINEEVVSAGNVINAAKVEELLRQRA